MTIPAFRALDNFLAARAPWQMNLFGLALVGVIGALDHYTGFELSFSVFYLLPIVLVTWYLGRPASLVMCLLSALAWLGTDYTSGHTYSAAWMPFWNAAVRMLFFALIAYLISEMKLRLQVEQLTARTDPLTGLKNSLAFAEEADLLFKAAKRYRHPLTVSFIDLDNFKSVNDELGHAEGDRALKTVGATLQLSIRESDVAARLGGDEFALVLSHTDTAGARTFFDRLHGRLQWAMREGNWPIGFSIGVAIFAGDVPSYGDAVKSADTLMYRVKSGGGNNVIYEVFPAGKGAPTDTIQRMR